MKKSLVLTVVLLSSVYAAYNPFFTDLTQQKKEAPVITKPVPVEPEKPLPPRETMAITYLGYVESNKGKFALVNFNGHNIVVKQRDSLYLGVQVFRVKDITSNYIVMQDTNYRTQTIYFTSDGV